MRGVWERLADWGAVAGRRRRAAQSAGVCCLGEVAGRRCGGGASRARRGGAGGRAHASAHPLPAAMLAGVWVSNRAEGGGGGGGGGSAGSGRSRLPNAAGGHSRALGPARRSGGEPGPRGSGAGSGAPGADASRTPAPLRPAPQSMHPRCPSWRPGSGGTPFFTAGPAPRAVPRPFPRMHQSFRRQDPRFPTGAPPFMSSVSAVPLTPIPGPQPLPDPHRLPFSSEQPRPSSPEHFPPLRGPGAPFLRSRAHSPSCRL